MASSPSITDWLVAIGTVGTLAAAVGQLSLTEALRRRAANRAQAEQVSAWFSEQGGGGKQRVVLFNMSGQPVYQVVVSPVLIQGAGPSDGRDTQPADRRTIGVLPPGESFVWVNQFSYGMNRRPGVELAFTDHAGRHWVRTGLGGLIRLSTAPVSYYKLGLPAEWTTVVRG